MSNYFRDYFANTDDKMLMKMDHYLDIYAKLLRDWQGRDVRFLEIGVFKGGSIRMWRDFFGKESSLTFLDIDPACKAHQIEGTTVEIGDQTDRAFLARIAKEYGPFDIIIDDGGHKMDQQSTSFRALWPYLNDGGLYVVEDTHTSYWPGFGSGYQRKGSFIELAKNLVDRFHSWYTDQDDIFPHHAAAEQVGSISFYDSMVVFERQNKEMPFTITSMNGNIAKSYDVVKLRNRKSIF
jgi:cephalosporin hydroxylase